jgi:fumarylpyruvate hydrolase
VGGPITMTALLQTAFAAPAPVIVPVKGRNEGYPVRRIYCVGRNYVEHAIEMGHTGREAPFFFLKPADTVVAVREGAIGRMHYPGATTNLHHELELVVAIGQGGADIAAEQALGHVFGYAVGLDMTRRDLQNESKKMGRPWDTGKGFDESAPIGEIVPAVDCRIAADTALELTVNGAVRQRSTIGKLIWSIPEIIEHLSRLWTLAPGDLIYTGTPEGVNAVVVGDRMVARVDGLPELTVDVVARKS